MQCLTKAFNASNEEHVKAKQDIEIGNGLPGIRTTAEVDQALKDAGLEVCPFPLFGEYSPGIRTTAEVDQVLARHPHHCRGRPSTEGRRPRGVPLPWLWPLLF